MHIIWLNFKHIILYRSYEMHGIVHVVVMTTLTYTLTTHEYSTCDQSKRSG